MITAHQFAENKVTPQQSSFLHRGVCGTTQNMFGDANVEFPLLSFFKSPPLCASDENTKVRITGNVNYKLLKVMPLFDTGLWISTPGSPITNIIMRVHGWSSVVQGSKQNEKFIPFLISEVKLSYNASLADIIIPAIYNDNSTSITCKGASAIELSSTTAAAVPVSPLLFNPAGTDANRDPAYFIIDTQGAQYLQFSVKHSSNIEKAYTALLTPYSL